MEEKRTQVGREFCCIADFIKLSYQTDSEMNHDTGIRCPPFANVASTRANEATVDVVKLTPSKPNQADA